LSIIERIHWLLISPPTYMYRNSKTAYLLRRMVFGATTPAIKPVLNWYLELKYANHLSLSATCAGTRTYTCNKICWRQILLCSRHKMPKVLRF
jgi:hypothetical protein